MSVSPDTPKGAQAVEQRYAQAERQLRAAVASAITAEVVHTGITQRELASRLGVSEGRVSQLLNAEVNHTLGTLARVGVALGRTVSIRFGATSTQKPSSLWERAVTTDVETTWRLRVGVWAFVTKKHDGIRWSIGRGHNPVWQLGCASVEEAMSDAESELLSLDRRAEDVKTSSGMETIAAVLRSLKPEERENTLLAALHSSQICRHCYEAMPGSDCWCTHDE